MPRLLRFVPELRLGNVHSGSSASRTLRSTIVPPVPNKNQAIEDNRSTLNKGAARDPVDKLQEICILVACTCQKPAICVRLRSLVGAAIL